MISDDMLKDMKILALEKTVDRLMRYVQGAYSEIESKGVTHEDYYNTLQRISFILQKALIEYHKDRKAKKGSKTGSRKVLFHRNNNSR